MKIQLPYVVIAGAVLLTAAPAMATDLNLTAGGSGTVNGAIFTTTDNQSTGTGVIDSFVRLSDQNGPADGYNATARPVMGDVNTSPTFTHDIRVGDIPEVTLSGLVYYEFLLDINQTSSDPGLSLDELQIYTRTTAIADADDLPSLSGSSTLRYDLDIPSNNRVLLNYNLNSGSGSGDLFVYVLKSAFGAASDSDFLYLYSLFGEDNANDAFNENDGFEEWAIRTTTPVNIPDGGATMTLLGSALLGVSLLRRRFGRS